MNYFKDELSLEQSIVCTLAWFSTMERPITFQELYKYLWRNKAKQENIHEELNKLCLLKKIKAENIDDKNASITNNFGVLYWAKENLGKAETFFKKAKAIEDTDEISYNVGVLQLKDARYQEAVTSFGANASFNKALAQLLSGNTSGAKSTLNSVESEEGHYYYLKAVVAARESNGDDLFQNLQKAVQADASLKAYAINDVEFRAFFDDETFKSIVK